MGAPGTTPGPWKADPADMFGDHNVTLKDTSECCLAIAAVVSNLRPAEEVAANANLIAASPELYDALVNARQWVLSFPVVVDHARQTMLAQIDAALAKARGEA